ncbi:PQQ-binding-like beta-propeller repeat protein [bacterium]|nr:PQQ-binding-like beta-propeller repeat protein [bacterium]
MRCLAPAALLLLAALPVLRATAPPDRWPAFRGTGDSISDAKALPLKWSPTENVAWTTELPGYGQSSPVVWADRVFVTSAEGEFKDTLHVLRLDLATGKEAWRKSYPNAARVKATDYVSKSAPTPVVTADRVFALFESGDLFALDHDGKEQWRRNLAKDFGPLQGNHGLGTSPVLAGDTLLVLVAQGNSYLLAVDAVTGKDRWRAEHPFGGSWTSPAVVQVDGKPVAVVSSPGLAAAFDVATGAKLWELGGLTGNTVATPTPAGELLVLGSSDRASQVAVRVGAKADERVAWRSAEGVSSFGSPLVYGKYGYTVSRDGVAYCFDPATGKSVWDHRLPGSCWASPVGGVGHVFFFTKDGVTAVVKPGPEPEVVAENRLPGRGRVYGVAAVEGAFLVRTGTALHKIGR